MASTMDDELIAEFVVESNEHLADIESQLLSMEAAGADVDGELVNTVFRAIHSIKGAAGFFGLTTIGTLAHRMENLLNLVRNNELIPTSAIVDVLLKSADTLQNLLNDTASSNGVDVSGHLTALDAVVEQEDDAEAPAAVQEHKLAEDECSGDGVEPEETPPEAAVEAEPTEGSTAPRPASTAVERTTPGSQDETPRQNGPRQASPAAADASIRVSVGVLDLLMNLAGELVLSRNRLLQIVGLQDNGALEAVAAGLDQVTSELQEAIMQTRMQPIGNIFGRFRRIVRDLSAQLGKGCELKIDGADVEVDKSILEAIGDPLTHLIRNAVDHGVETPEKRRAAGKSEGGVIHLRAFHQAGKVNISVSDDGGGIDAARLKEKAVARGIISPEQASSMSRREAVRLIFHPGFSMAESVSDVSGRGVGMDVVRTNLEKLGGTIEIKTKVGSGTTIDVKLPLTLAIVPSLIVGCEGRRFAIPQANISELVRITEGDTSRHVERLRGAEVLRLRGALLPLVRLERALDIHGENDTAHDERKTQYIVVVESGNLRYGLVADALYDSEEIVIKPLGRHLQDSCCLAGATILGDGDVALILDVATIATHVQLTMPADAAENGDASTDVGKAEKQAVLLLKNHPKEQFAIPMELVRRLERIRTDQIDTVGGREILQYRGGTLPLLRIEGLVSATPPEDATTCHVVVFGVAKREVGLLVPELVDIHQIGLDLDTTAFNEPGVLGSFVFDGVPTRLLDMYELAKTARPEWFEVESKAADTEAGPTRVLVAEDSDFFRKQLLGFLEKDGYDVVGCEDGQIAWDLLQQADQQFDVVVTDVEMPNMTGFELSRKIKDDPALSWMPVIAVTSLASEEDMQRGTEAGVDAYHVKLDQETLLEAVAGVVRSVHRPSPQLS